MNITKSQLKKIIKEELEKVIQEGLRMCYDGSPIHLATKGKSCPNAGKADLGDHPEFGWLGTACVCNTKDPKEVHAARNKKIMQLTANQQKDHRA